MPTRRILSPRERNLTPREREALELVADGLSTAAIADMMGISRHTVFSHLGSAEAKLGAHNRAEAVGKIRVRPDSDPLEIAEVHVLVPGREPVVFVPRDA